MLRSDPSLAAVPDLSPAQLQDLSRCVEQTKQKLEEDISHYITRKQHELRQYEREVCSQHRMPSLGSGALLKLIGLARRQVPFNGMRPADSRFC